MSLSCSVGYDGARGRSEDEFHRDLGGARTVRHTRNLAERGRVRNVRARVAEDHAVKCVEGLEPQVETDPLRDAGLLREAEVLVFVREAEDVRQILPAGSKGAGCRQ